MENEEIITDLKIKEYELRLKHMELAMTSGRHHEKIRNSYFNYYLVISGVYFAITDKISSNSSTDLFPLFFAIFIFIIGIVMISLILRAREMVQRDVKIIKVASELPSINSTLSSIDDVYREYYITHWPLKEIKKWGASNFLFVAISLISSGIITLGFLSFNFSFCLNLLIFLISASVHFFYILVVGRKVKKCELN